MCSSADVVIDAVDRLMDGCSQRRSSMWCHRKEESGQPSLTRTFNRFTDGVLTDEISFFNRK